MGLNAYDDVGQDAYPSSVIDIPGVVQIRIFMNIIAEARQKQYLYFSFTLNTHFTKLDLELRFF